MSLFLQKQFKGNYSPEGKEKEVFDAFKEREEQLDKVKSNDHGLNIEAKWRDADEMYPPHEFSVPEEWMSKASQSLVFEKVQTALSIFVEKNPDAVFTALDKRFKGKELFIKKCYEWNYDVTDARSEVEKFIFNLCLYGFAVGRAYIKEINGFQEPYTENLNPYDVWIDDMAKPRNRFSVRDWMWRRVYQYEDAKKEFGHYPNFKFVQPGGDTAHLKDQSFVSDNLVEILFYENEPDDKFIIVANDVMLTWDELPYAHKRLSLFTGLWNYRSSESIYGIGLAEILKANQNLVDKILNMSINELVLSIHPFGLYSGAQNLDKDFLKIEPNTLKRVQDATKVNWLQRNSGQSIKGAQEMVEYLRDLTEKDTGITKAVAGEVLGKTAFEALQSKETGLRRLTPALRNVQYGLQTRAGLINDLIQEAYKQPKIEKILSEEEIGQYTQEIQKRPEMFTRTEKGIAKLEFRKVPMKLDRKEKGNKIGNGIAKLFGKKPDVTFEEGKEENIFELTPEEIQFEGEIKINVENMLMPSKELERQKALEKFQVIAQLPVTDLYKSASNVISGDNSSEPNDWLVSQQEMDAEAEKAKQGAKSQANIEAMQQEMSNMQSASGQASKKPISQSGGAKK